MKTKTRRLTTIATALAILGLGTLSMAAKKESEAEIQGSVAVAKKTPKARLAQLATTKLADALQIALKAVPGDAIEAELEVEDHFLVYSIDIIDSQQRHLEVVVDAGDGKILQQEIEDGEKHGFFHDSD